MAKDRKGGNELAVGLAVVVIWGLLIVLIEWLRQRRQRQNPTATPTIVPQADIEFDAAGLEPVAEMHESDLVGYLHIKRTGRGRETAVVGAWCLEHAKRGRRRKGQLVEVLHHEAEKLSGYGCLDDGCCAEW